MMLLRGRSVVLRLSVANVAAGLVVCAVSGPAAAEGLIESFFGELRQALSGVSSPAPIRKNARFADPISSLHHAQSDQPERYERVAPDRDHGPARAFCVRTCDGRYLPVQSRPGMSAAEACQSFCPASETRLYAGSNIDYAVARDGSRYASMRNAFVYRKRVVAGCTCNGRDAFGLAHIDVKDDPTLRRGDVVATRGGLVAYTGDRNQRADFTPVESYSGFSKSYRETLSDIRVTPPGTVNYTPARTPLTTGAIDTNDDNLRSAQLSR
jgi:hypothetical protein